MPVIISKKSSFELAPAGTHYATCIGVYDIGTQETTFGPKPKIVLMFELTDTPMGDGRPFTVRGIYNVSLGKNKSGKMGPLRELLEGWRGKPFTDKELEGFDIGKLCGVAALLNVVHEASGEATYANIKSASPLLKGMARLKPSNPILMYSIPDDGENFPAGMPDWIVDKVKGSLEWAAKNSVPDEVDEEPNVLANEDAETVSGEIPF